MKIHSPNSRNRWHHTEQNNEIIMIQKRIKIYSQYKSAIFEKLKEENVIKISREKKIQLISTNFFNQIKKNYLIKIYL